MAAKDPSLLGTYVLPGPATDPLAGLGQTTEAERLGLGSIWLSELQGPLKDAGAICGYMGHSTSRITVGTSVTHFGTRHPMVLASWAATMQVLTGGRFALGFGRSVPSRWVDWGLPVPTISAMEDFASILRSLWAHETVSYDGPAGRFPKLEFEAAPDFDPPPLLLAAIGPKTLELVGRAFDGVLLHPFLNVEAVARSRDIVREAAEKAGRDPDAVTIYHQVVTAPDMGPEEIDLVVRARATAYFSHPGFGEPLALANGWDPAPLATLRSEVKRAMAENEAAGSPLKGRQILMGPGKVLPDEWITTGAAVGTASECSARLKEYLDAGADQIVVHGVTADGLGPTVQEFSS